MSSLFLLNYVIDRTSVGQSVSKNQLQQVRMSSCPGFDHKNKIKTY